MPSLCCPAVNISEHAVSHISKTLLCDVNKFTFHLISLLKGRVTKRDVVTQNLGENGVADRNHMQPQTTWSFFFISGWNVWVRIQGRGFDPNFISFDFESFRNIVSGFAYVKMNRMLDKYPYPMSYLHVNK